jgi:NADPH2:quinone reductase
VKDFAGRPGVYYQAPHHDRLGSYAQYALVDQRLVAKKPKRLSFAEAAAAPLVLITAWEALHDRVDIKSWHKLLVHAGAGGVGHIAIQLARIAGAEVCATVGSADKAEFARSFGATRTINYKEENFVTAVLDWTGGQGVDIAFDTVGGKTRRNLSAVRYYGDVAHCSRPTRNGLERPAWAQPARELRADAGPGVLRPERAMTRGEILPRCRAIRGLSCACT